MAKSSNPYLSQTGRPRLLRSVAAFIDLLGYRVLSEEMGHGPFVRVLRNTFRTALQSLIPRTGHGEAGIPSPWMTKAFTDNIVLGFPIAKKNGELEMGIVFSRLGEFQLQMTRAGFFLRGAIAVGKLYMDEHIVFGPALIEAYEAERKLARDPRIVLAASASRSMKRHLRAYPRKRDSPQYHAVLEDPDRQYFINYLSGVVEFGRDMGYAANEYLGAHKRMISGRLEAFRSQPRVWSKYLWTAAYHNFFCSERAAFAEYLIDLAAQMPSPARLRERSRTPNRPMQRTAGGAGRR